MKAWISVLEATYQIILLPVKRIMVPWGRTVQYLWILVALLAALVAWKYGGS